jgi:hypothetical protein
LRQRFGIRLFDVVGGTGPLTLLTDGQQIYARTKTGDFYNLLRAPSQPLLVVGMDPPMREITARVRAHRRRPKRRPKEAKTAVKRKR